MTIEPCSVCREELATVRLATEAGAVCVGPQCARILEALGKLMGLNTRRRPVLERVK